MSISVEVIIFLLLLFIATRRYRTKLYLKCLPYLVIFTFMAIRYDYGDGKSYRELFNNLHNGADAKDIEPFYVWLNRILPSFELVVLVTSAIYVFAIYLLVSNTLTYRQRGLALFVMALHPYILMVDMSAIRQSVAIALAIIGVYVANKYKTIYFVPFCLIAALFHKSALILFPLLFIFGKRHFTTKMKMAILGGTVFFLLVPEKLFVLIEAVLSATKLNTLNYLSYLYNGNENSALAVLLSLIIMAFFMLCGDAVDHRNAIYVKLSIIAMVFEALQGKVQQFGRIDMYFLPFLIISLPLILKGNPQRLTVQFMSKEYSFNKYACWIVETCFVGVFAWKFMSFMTPQYAYYSIFTARQ